MRFGFGSFNTDLGIGDDAFGFGSFNTDLGIGDDAFGFGNTTTENNDEKIKEGINTYKKEGINTYKKEDNEKITDKVEGKNQWWDFLDLFPNKKNDVSTEESSESITRASYNPGLGYNPFGPEGGSTYGNPRYVSTKKKSKHVDLKIFGAPGLGYNPFGPEGGSTYGDPRYDPYSLIKSTNTTDNNSNNEVIDGGTTVIEGTTEVVDGGTVGNNQRGEVRASTSLVKPTNSPVLAVKLSENNSIREFVVG
jgi:hypothetical protein